MLIKFEVIGLLHLRTLPSHVAEFLLKKLQYVWKDMLYYVSWGHSLVSGKVEYELRASSY